MTSRLDEKHLSISGCFPAHVGGENESSIPKVKAKSQLIGPSNVGLLEGDKTEKKAITSNLNG